MDRLIDTALTKSPTEAVMASATVQNNDLYVLSQEMGELIDQHEAVSDAVDAIGSVRTFLQYTQENGLENIEAHQRLMALTIESVIGDTDFVPETIDDASLEQLEKRLEWTQENLLEAITDKFKELSDSLFQNVDELEAKRDELSRALGELEETNQGATIQLTKTAASYLTQPGGKIEPEKLAGDLRDTNNDLKEYNKVFFSYMNALFDHIGRQQDKITSVKGDADDEEKSAVLEESWSSLEKLVQQHMSNIHDMEHVKMLGRRRIKVGTLSKWKVDVKKNGKLTNMPTPQIANDRNLKVADRKVEVGDKKSLMKLLDETSNTLEMLKASKDYIQSIRSAMDTAGRKADDVPTTRRNIDAIKGLMLPAGFFAGLAGGTATSIFSTSTAGATIGVLAIAGAALYFGDGFKRQSRHTIDALRISVNYQFHLAQSSLELVEKSINESK